MSATYTVIHNGRPRRVTESDDGTQVIQDMCRNDAQKRCGHCGSCGQEEKVIHSNVRNQPDDGDDLSDVPLLGPRAVENQQQQDAEPTVDNVDGLPPMLGVPGEGR